MNVKRIGAGLLAAGLLLWACGMNAQTNSNPGLYFSMQFPNWPPLPGNPLSVQSYWQSNRVDGVPVYLYDDRDIDYAELAAENSDELESMRGYGMETESASFGPDDLWLEVLSVDLASHFIYLRLHETIEGNYYQLLSTRNLLTPTDRWKPGEIKSGASGTNQTDFSAVAFGSDPQMFFRAHKAEPIVGIDRDQDAIEPDPGQVGMFHISGSNFTNDLAVYYRISGSAQNGVDYVDGTTQTNLSGIAVLSSTNGYYVQIYIDPIEDNIVEFEETVTLTLVVTNTYLIQPGYETATITISDPTNYFVAVVTNLPSPVGIDFHAPSSSLVVSYHYLENGLPNNFALINSNGVVLTNWSGVNSLSDEVKLATVRTSGFLTNSAGFTNGDMYFGSGSDIGWLSADGTRSNLTWCTLTNDIVTNVLPLRGSLYIDQTGVWSNQLVGVASDGSNDPGDKGIWRVDVNRHPSLVANIFTRHLEGVVTLTNDVQRWGPWAGKIITGDEDARDADGSHRPLVYSINIGGVVDSYALDIEPEDFDIIQTNQDLYCVDFQGSSCTILKLSHVFLQNYVGDIVITQAGEYDIFTPPNPHPARLFFVHWDSTKGDFVIRRLTLPEKYAGEFEHVTFAPIHLPPVD